MSTLVLNIAAVVAKVLKDICIHIPPESFSYIAVGVRRYISNLAKFSEQLKFCEIAESSESYLHCMTKDVLVASFAILYWARMLKRIV